MTPAKAGAATSDHYHYASENNRPALDTNPNIWIITAKSVREAVLEVGERAVDRYWPSSGKNPPSEWVRMGALVA